MLRILLSALTLFLGVSVAAQAAVPRSYVQAYAQDDAGQGTINVLHLDDPANPYCGQYSDWDRFLFSNYNPQLNDGNMTEFSIAQQGLESSLRQQGQELKLTITSCWVEFDAATATGWMLPSLTDAAWMRPSPEEPNTLGLAMLRNPSRGTWQQPANIAKFGVMGFHSPSDPAYIEHRKAQAVQAAASYPPIEEWMLLLGAAGSRHVFLPDGSLVVMREVGEIAASSDRYQQAGGPQWMPASYLALYSADGELLRDAVSEGSYGWVRWEDKLLHPIPAEVQERYLRRVDREHRAPSGRLSGTSNNQASTSRYTMFRNEAGDAYTAVFDHLTGQVLTEGDLAALPMPDYPYFVLVNHDYLVWMYQQQQLGKQLVAQADQG